MLSFHGNDLLKLEYIARVLRHTVADEIIKGQYWENGKGCAVGCTVHSSDHNVYETELGLPEWLAELEDVLFEGMPNVKAMLFPAAFLAAIPVGVDLNPVERKFCAFLMDENAKALKGLNISTEIKQHIIGFIGRCRVIHETQASDDMAEAAEKAGLAASVFSEKLWDMAEETSYETHEKSEQANVVATAAAIMDATTLSLRYSTWSTSSAAARISRIMARGILDRQMVYSRYADKLLKLLAAA